MVFSGEYIWKYTHNAFDFSVLGNTPITFPIDWHNSKIPGYALHADVPEFHNFSAYFVASSVAARFFPPQSAGLAPLRRQAVLRSASITMRSSIRQRICNTRLASAGRGRRKLAVRLGPGGRVGTVCDQQHYASRPERIDVRSAGAGRISLQRVTATRTAGFQSCAPQSIRRRW